MDAPSALPVHRRRSWLVSGAMLALAIGLAVLLGEADRTPGPADDLPEGYPSTTVAELSAGLPQATGSSAVVLFTADEGALSRPQLAELGQVLTTVSDARAPRILPSEDGTAALAVLPVAVTGPLEVQAAVEELRAALGDAVPAGVSAQVTGPAAIQADLASVFDGADSRLLASTAAVVALLLLITYRSPLLWLVPLLVVAVADRLAVVAATHTLDAFGVVWDPSTTGILSVLVFGAGTDYALLLISRYRDELRLAEDRYLAMTRALRATLEAVLASATTVILGLLTLLLSVFPATRGLGLACAVGVAVAAVYALVALPATLVLFGRWVFWPLVPRVGQTPLADSPRSWWRRIGERVSARPTGYVVVAVLLLGALASPLTGLRTGLPQAEQFLDKPEAIVAAERLAESFPAGTSDPAVVLTRADPQSVVEIATRTDGVESARATLSANGLTRVDVVLADPAGSDAAQESLGGLREALGALPDTWVGGTEARAVDAADAAARDRWLIIPLILVLVLVALFVLLRSLVAPVILVLTVVGTYFASLGLSWLLFTGPFGFENLDDGVPLLAFLFLVALGVDYNIFLVTRAAEETPAHGSRQGMLRALTATGGVITSAGVLLAAVFAVLGVLPLVVLAQLGVVICVGVLLDTLLVRTVLVPAIAWRAGDLFWWPRRLGRGRAPERSGPEPVTAGTVASGSPSNPGGRGAPH